MHNSLQREHNKPAQHITVRLQDGLATLKCMPPKLMSTTAGPISSLERTSAHTRWMMACALPGSPLISSRIISAARLHAPAPPCAADRVGTAGGQA